MSLLDSYKDARQQSYNRFRNASPVPLSSTTRSRFGLGSAFDRSSKVGQLAAYGEVGTVMAIVQTTSQAVSAVDWKMFRQQVDARRAYGPAEMQRTEVTKHLALQVLNKPNPFFTRQELFETVEQHIDLVGEGWLLVSKNALGLPQELWPIRPDRIDPVPHPTEFLSGYIYYGPDGEQIPLEVDEVIQIRVPSPLDLYRGMGPVQSVIAEIQGVQFSAEWNRNFFLNGAEPGGIIQVPEQLSDVEYRQLRTRWNEQHKGISAAHRVAILTANAQWIDRKYTNRDMQFVELRNVGRDAIREAWRVPKFALGDIDDVNRATAEASKAWFAEQLTVPRLERWKQALNNDFLPMFGITGEGREFDYCDPVPPDAEVQNQTRESKARTYSTLISARVAPEDAAMVAELPVMRTVTAPTDGGGQSGQAAPANE